MEITSPSFLTVRTTLLDSTSLEFSRWLDALLDSLAAAVGVGLLGTWAIAVDDRRTTPLSDEAWALAEAQVVGAGGALLRGAAVDVDASERDLILLVSADAVLAGSTVSRLLRSPEAGTSAVAARELPLGGSSCVLVPGASTDSPADEGTGAGETRHDPAVVFRARQLTPGGAEILAGGGALVELAVDVQALAPIHQRVAKALGAGAAPVLTVVVRTQGLRPEALRDALLCLAGQSDPRFEVVLVVHDAPEAPVASVVADMPLWLRSRTRIVTATGGTRAHPLNVGIAEAAGSLVAFLDDDDLVLAEWVAAFHAGADAAPRRVVRLAAAAQQVKRTLWVGDIEGHEVEGPVELPYPTTFDLADHLRVNRTPFMAVAFPAAFFAVFGGADEQLEVCEDWDLIVRAASVVGVVDVPVVGAIYRRWTTGGDSYSLHRSSAWERDMLVVRAKLDSMAIILPPGSASELAEFSALRPVRDELAAVYASTSWRASAPLRWLARRLGR